MNLLRIIAILVLCGCGGDKSTPVPSDPNGIEIVYAGSEPRRPLRYQIAKGDSIELELAMDVELDAGGRGGPLPTVIVGAQLVATDVLPDAAMRVRATITSLAARDVPNSTVTAESMTEHMQLLKGTTLTGTLVPSGGLRDLHAEATTKLPPALAQQLDSLAKSFEQIAVPLPRSAVGNGAAWRHRRTIDQSGMKLLSVTTIVVSAIDEHGFAFTSTSSLGGPDQTVTLMNHPIRMTSIGGVGTGKGTIDLRSLVMTGESTMSFHSDMTADGETDQMGMTLTTRVARGKLPAPDGGDGEALAGPTELAEPTAPAAPDDNAPVPDNTEFAGENAPMPETAPVDAAPADPAIDAVVPTTKRARTPAR